MDSKKSSLNRKLMRKLQKQKGHSASEQKKAAMAALVHVCAVCKVKVLQKILN